MRSGFDSPGRLTLHRPVQPLVSSVSGSLGGPHSGPRTHPLTVSISPTVPSWTAARRARRRPSSPRSSAICAPATAPRLRERAQGRLRRRPAALGQRHPRRLRGAVGRGKSESRFGDDARQDLADAVTGAASVDRDPCTTTPTRMNENCAASPTADVDQCGRRARPDQPPLLPRLRIGFCCPPAGLCGSCWSPA